MTPEEHKRLCDTLPWSLEEYLGPDIPARVIASGLTKTELIARMRADPTHKYHGRLENPNPEPIEWGEK